MSAWICRWFRGGHRIKAEFAFVEGEVRWRFWCERCLHALKGPDP